MESYILVFQGKWKCWCFWGDMEKLSGCWCLWEDMKTLSGCWCLWGDIKTLFGYWCLWEDMEKPSGYWCLWVDMESCLGVGVSEGTWRNCVGIDVSEGHLTIAFKDAQWLYFCPKKNLFYRKRTVVTNSAGKKKGNKESEFILPVLQCLISPRMQNRNVWQGLSGDISLKIANHPGSGWQSCSFLALSRIPLAEILVS